jgi:hypothetical protein
MRPFIPALALLALFAAPTAARAQKIDQPKYDEWFTDEALRVDLVHSGTRGAEAFAVEELVAEPIWPGTRVHLVDPTGFGQYRFRAFDQATGREIFSQGYCSLFGEWLATEAAARGERRAMPEPLRMPFPRRPVSLALEVRDNAKGAFVEPRSGGAYFLRRGLFFCGGGLFADLVRALFLQPALAIGRTRFAGNLGAIRHAFVVVAAPRIRRAGLPRRQDCDSGHRQRDARRQKNFPDRRHGFFLGFFLAFVAHLKSHRVRAYQRFLLCHLSGTQHAEIFSAQRGRHQHRFRRGDGCGDCARCLLLRFVQHLRLALQNEIRARQELHFGSLLAETRDLQIHRLLAAGRRFRQRADVQSRQEVDRVTRLRASSRSARR